MAAGEDVVLQDGADDLTLVVFKGGSEGGVGDFVEGFVVGGEDGDVGLEGEIGVDVPVGSQQRGEFGEVLVRLKELGEVFGGAGLCQGKCGEGEASDERKEGSGAHPSNGDSGSDSDSDSDSDKKR